MHNTSDRVCAMRWLVLCTLWAGASASIGRMPLSLQSSWDGSAYLYQWLGRVYRWGTHGSARVDHYVSVAPTVDAVVYNEPLGLGAQHRVFLHYTSRQVASVQVAGASDTVGLGPTSPWWEHWGNATFCTDYIAFGGVDTYCAGGEAAVLKCTDLSRCIARMRLSDGKFHTVLLSVLEPRILWPDSQVYAGLSVPTISSVCAVDGMECHAATRASALVTTDLELVLNVTYTASNLSTPVVGLRALRGVVAYWDNTARTLHLYRDQQPRAGQTNSPSLAAVFLVMAGLLILWVLDLRRRGRIVYICLALSLALHAWVAFALIGKHHFPRHYVRETHGIVPETWVTLIKTLHVSAVGVLAAIMVYAKYTPDMQLLVMAQCLCLLWPMAMISVFETDAPLGRVICSAMGLTFLYQYSGHVMSTRPDTLLLQRGLKEGLKTALRVFMFAWLLMLVVLVCLVPLLAYRMPPYDRLGLLSLVIVLWCTDIGIVATRKQLK